MSKYSYHIAFNSSDYTEIYPNNPVTITESVMEDSFIWIKEINELKINKSLNSSVYDTLESWYTDSSKFPLEIYFNIKKNGVLDSEYIFGVKQGKIDYEIKTYTVQPVANDNYAAILKNYEKYEIQPTADIKRLSYINEDDGYDEIGKYLCNTFKDCATDAKDYINSTESKSLGIASSFLWNDNWPSGASSGTLNVVSSDYNDLNSILLGRRLRSIKDTFDAVKPAQCYWYIDSNEDIRFEHVSYFINGIEDYQADLSNDLRLSDRQSFEYIDSSVFPAEAFRWGDNNYDIDFDNPRIIYDAARTNYRSLIKENIFESITDFRSDNVSIDNLLSVTSVQLGKGYKYQTAGFTALTKDGINITAGNGAGGAYYETNYFYANGTMSYEIDVVLTSGAINMQVYVSGVAQDSPVSLANGNNAGSITMYENGYIRFSLVGNTIWSYTAAFVKTDDFTVKWEAGEVSGLDKGNCYLSWANLHERFYKDYRISRVGYLNNIETTFNSTVYNKRPPDIRIYYPDAIDVRRGIKTDYGIAMIESYERDLDTDFVNFSLLYQEDE